MKNHWIVLGLALLASITFTFGQGTAFTYQGRMTAPDGSPVTAVHDIQVSLFPALTGGSALASQTLNGVSINNGLFVLTIDFGAVQTAALFNGDDRWLEIHDLTTAIVFPRQHLTATPYAITASNLSGTLPAAQ